MRKRLFAIGLFCGLSLSGLAEKEPDRIVIPKTVKAPEIDGKLSPGEWDNAVAITGFQHIYNYLTSRQMISYLTYDNERFYLGFRSTFPSESKLKRFARRRDDKFLCKDDAVELFIAPDYEKRRSLDFQFLGNSLSVIQDFQARPDVANILMAWNGKWDYRCTSGPGWWEGELSIKLAELELKPGKDFGLNVCRDYYPYFFTNWTSGGYRNYAKCTFGGDCPVVQITDLGDIARAKANLKIKLDNRGKAGGFSAEIQVLDALEDKVLLTKSEKFNLKAGEKKDFNLKADWSKKVGEIKFFEGEQRGSEWIQWQKKDKKKLILTIKDDSSKQVLLRHLFFVKEGIKDYVKADKGRVFDVVAELYPSYDRLKCAVDIYDFPQKNEAADIKISVLAPGNILVAENVIDKFRLGYGETTVKLPEASNKKAGENEVKFQAVDNSGRVLAEEKTSFVKKKFPWEGVHKGNSGKVIAPYTPLELEADGFWWWKNYNTVKCWGREYKFSNNGMLEKVMTRKQEILASPIELTGKTKTGSINFKTDDSLKVVKSEPEAIRLDSKSKSGNIELNTQIDIEYDGMIKYTLELSSKNNEKVDELSLKIPLKNKNAILYHACGESVRVTNQAGYVPEGDGLVWSSKNIKNSVVKGTFIPYFWLGDYDRGFCWMADNDKGWSTDDKKACIEFIREKDVLYARINFINQPTLLNKPRKIIFALMAGPVKPEYTGWRLDPNRSVWFCGEQTLQGYGTPPDPERYYKWAKRMKKERGYWGVNTSPNDLWGRTEENLYYQAEWHPGYPSIKRNDFVMYNLERLIDEGLVDGVYSDDVYPVVSDNIITGTGYIREDGKIQAGYSMFALRDFYKRAATIFREKNCSRRMMVHMTDSMVMPCYNFWDIKHDNEWERTHNAITSYPLGEVCARSMSRQYGMAASWHTPCDWKSNPEDGGDELSCILLLHDIIGRVETMDNRTLPAKKLFGIGAPDVEFMGYWVLQPDKDPREKDIKISAWVRKKEGTALITIANLSEKGWTGEIVIPFEKLDLANNSVIFNVEEYTHKEIPVDSGKIKLSIPRHNYRLLMVSPTGKFPTNRQPKGYKLAENLKIDKVNSDDFNGNKLNPAWKLNCSKLSEGLIRLRRNRLQVLGKDYKFAVAEKPFTLADASVQVKIESKKSHSSVGLLLLWADGNYVFAGIVADNFNYSWQENGKGHRFRGSKINQENPGSMHQENWVKIKLDKDKIIFLSSADGEEWKQAKEIKRQKGFEGSPKVLRLGKCPSGKEAKHDINVCPVYFDDLIISQ
jgi:hypothetical protein